MVCDGFLTDSTPGKGVNAGAGFVSILCFYDPVKNEFIGLNRAALPYTRVFAPPSDD